MAVIDIGEPFSIQTATLSAGYTYIYLGNPANLAGTITEVWVQPGSPNASGVYFGIFEDTGFLKNKCRSAVSIGSPPGGDWEHIAVSLDVQPGDRIGIYFSGGLMRHGLSGGSGWEYKAGNKCVVGNEETGYTSNASRLATLGGQGSTPSEGWPGVAALAAVVI